MSNKAILENLYPTVEKSLAVRANEQKLFNTIGNYVDRNLDKLSALGPTYRIPLLDVNKQGVYDAIGVTQAEIKATFKKSTHIKPSWQVVCNNPIYTACALCVRYYIMNNKVDSRDLLGFYLTMCMYPLLHWKYFKHNCNEYIMNYTISNLSNKYKYKQFKSLMNTMKDLSIVCIKIHEPRLKVGGDKEFVDFINDVHSRLNDNLKNVAIEYYANHKEGNYLNVETEDKDEENYREIDNSSYTVDRAINKVMTTASMNGPNFQLVSMAAKMCDVSVNELKNIALQITSEECLPEFKSIIESILYIYLFDMHRSIDQIKSKDYIIAILELYKKTNNKDKNLVNIRYILDKWIDDFGVRKRISRAATINNFKKSMYIFVCLTIQDNI